MKYIICLLFFFTASCVSQRKHQAAAQTIVDWAQRTIDGIHVTTGPRDTSCRHIWVAVEKDTIPEADWRILWRADKLHVYGKGLVCVKCLDQRNQLVYSPGVHHLFGPEPKRRKP